MAGLDHDTQSGAIVLRDGAELLAREVQLDGSERSPAPPPSPETSGSLIAPERSPGVEPAYALLVDDRCPHCGEEMAAHDLLRGTLCAHCELPVASADAIGSVVAHTRRRARRSYAVAAVLGAASGLFPLVVPLASVIGFVYVRRWLLPPFLRWLSPPRRLHARLLLSGLFGLLTSAISAAGPLLGPLPVLAMPATAVLALLAVVLYSEVSVAYLQRQSRRELVESQPLRWWHWLVPALLALAVASVIATLATVLVVFYVVEGRLR